jgi:hypothetical protein
MSEEGRRCADRVNWRSGIKGDGVHGRGIAFLRYETTKTYVALIADILVIEYPTPFASSASPPPPILA